VYNFSTLTCKTLLSTFNRVNSNYTIVAYNNFVKAFSFNEPLQGIDVGIWNVKTPKTYNSAVSYSTEALLRLNPNGTKYFLSYDQANKTQLLDDILQQIKESIPLTDDRLKITRNVQLDPSDSTKLLIEFSVNKATDPSIEPSVNDIIRDLNDMIKNKYISALLNKKYMMFFDDQYGFQPKPNLWLEEIQSNINFREWFFKNANLVAFFTLFSITTVEALNALSSNFAGLDIFSSSVSADFKKWIFYGTTCHLFVKAIPQLVIQ
ncbi:20392_t:CDS:2, partial [Racocetra persica]